jgi:hypothetical protein
MICYNQFITLCVILQGRDIPIVHRVIKVVTYLIQPFYRLYVYILYLDCGLRLLVSLHRFMNAMIQPNLTSSQKVATFFSAAFILLHEYYQEQKYGV